MYAQPLLALVPIADSVTTASNRLIILLKDSITDCGDGDYGNGFTFQTYNAGDMLHAVERAVGLYNDYRDKWDGLVKRAMTTDFSWKNSAREYIKFYNEMF